MDEATKVKIMEDCPRFDFCDVPKCPLDMDIKLRVSVSGDKKCTMEKNVRLQIGKKWGLPKIGLTDAEYAGKIKFEALSKEEKEKLAERGRIALKSLKRSPAQD
jgi:hypothetical protein